MNHKEKPPIKIRWISKNIVLSVGVWLLIRIVTSIWVALLSPLSPLTPVENKIPAWPPSQPITDWLNRLFLYPWERWDTRWYLTIINNGYHVGDGTTSFHPLYPLLATILKSFGITPLLGMMLISTISTFVCMYFIKRLSDHIYGDNESIYSVFIFLFFPLAFILFAPYTEALFLAFSIGCFYYAYKHKWLLAGFIGMLASLTRQQGVLLAIPILCEVWIYSNKSFHSLITHYKGLFAALLPPSGMLLWIVIRGLAFTDVKPDLHSINGIIYSIFISPSANHVVPNASFTWPWVALWKAISIVCKNPDIDLLTNLALGGIFLALFIYSWKYMGGSFKLYSFIVILISFSYQTGSIHPYMGMPRHLFLAFPVFITLNILMKKPWQRLVWSALGLIVMLFLLLQFVFESWVP